MNQAVDDGRSLLQRWTNGERSMALAAAALALLLLVIFGDLLFAGGLDMPSHPQGDGARYFLWMRLFGYSELRGGNIPLWNPHVFSGTPFVGVFQSAMFYPPNWLHLFVGPRRGLMLEMFLHQWVLGVLVFAWLRNRRLHPLAAFTAAATVIFGATVSLRILAGQMTVLDTITWWPLVLLSLDKLAERIRLSWVLAGIGAFALMMLAGHPPTALQAGIATGLYVLPVLWRSHHRLPLILTYAVVAIAPIGLAAVQLFTGLHTAAEGLRSGATPGRSKASSRSRAAPQ